MWRGGGGNPKTHPHMVNNGPTHAHTMIHLKIQVSSQPSMKKEGEEGEGKRQRQVAKGVWRFHNVQQGTGGGLVNTIMSTRINGYVMAYNAMSPHIQGYKAQNLKPNCCLISVHPPSGPSVEGNQSKGRKNKKIGEGVG